MDAIRRQDFFRGRVLLAPLTKGGNLPFRRLCVELGAQVTMSEMAVAHHVVKGRRSEMALLRRGEHEPVFGVQLASRRPEELARAAGIAVERGADFVDLNVGCPIDFFCRRGLGAALLKKPRKLEALVRSMRDSVDVPVSVKIRLGYDEGKPLYLEAGRAAEAGGADAVVLHGRSRTQRYKRAADWSAVADLVEQLSVPVVGNGDLLTWRDAELARERSGCASVMLGRGALMKPWLFREISERRDYLLQPLQRLEVARRYRDLAREHFGDDARGRQRVHQFLEWHLDFFHRYRPVASESIDPEAHPLIQTRDDAYDGPDERLRRLCSTDPADLAHVAASLMDELEPAREEEGRVAWSAPRSWDILGALGTSISP